MSTNLNYKQVLNVERRTWDLEAYEKKAQQRQQELEQQEQSSSDNGRPRKGNNNNSSSITTVNEDKNDNDTDNAKEEFRPAVTGAAGPEGSDRAFLKRRTAQVKDIDTKVGHIEMVSVEAAATTSTDKTTATAATDIKQGVVKTGIGWHCKVCDCFLKDSHTYLDHINGRKHQRKLGFSMRVERSSKEDVQARLQSLAESRKKTTIGGGNDDEEEEPDFNAMVQSKDEELRKRREEKRRRRKERKKMLQTQQQSSHDQPTDSDVNKDDTGDPNRVQGDTEMNDPKETQTKETATETTTEEAPEEDEPQLDPNLAAMMGFSGFGGSSRNG